MPAVRKGLLLAMPKHHARSTSIGLPLIAALAVGVASSDAAQDREFGSEHRVTAMEIAVEAPAALRSRWRKDPGSKDLPVARVGGELVPVLSIEVAKEDSKAPIRPWSQVVYFDTELSAPGSIPWAAQLLGARLEDLVALGPVEILLGEDTPRRLVGPTRDLETLDQTLSGLAFDDPGQGRLPAFRRALLEARAEADDAYHSPEQRNEDDLIEEALEIEEIRQIQQRQDRLLGALLGDLLPANRESTQRVLYWVTSGYDLPDAGPADDAPLLSSSLAPTLAAYGWTIVPLLRPDPRAPLTPGLRIGKLRITGVGVTEAGDPSGRDDGPLIPVVAMAWEEDRKPKRARASYQRGRSLREQGDAAASEEAFREAIRYFHGDPRTAEEQALAWEQLAIVLESQERSEESRRASLQVERLRLAAANRRAADPESTPDPLDGEQAAAARTYESRLRDPDEPLQNVVAATAGNLVRGERSLDLALESLRNRALVTIQLAEGEPGALLPLTVEAPEGHPILRHRNWVRSGTPTRVTQARLRLVIAGVLDPDEASLAVDVVQFDERPDGSIKLVVDWDGPEEGPFRVSTAIVTLKDQDLEMEISHPPPTRNRPYELLLPQAMGAGLLGVLIEDIEGGDWGAILLDL